MNQVTDAEHASEWSLRTWIVNASPASWLPFPLLGVSLGICGLWFYIVGFCVTECCVFSGVNFLPCCRTWSFKQAATVCIRTTWQLSVSVCLSVSAVGTSSNWYNTGDQSGLLTVDIPLEKESVRKIIRSSSEILASTAPPSHLYAILPNCIWSWVLWRCWGMWAGEDWLEGVGTPSM